MSQPESQPWVLSSQLKTLASRVLYSWWTAGQTPDVPERSVLDLSRLPPGKPLYLYAGLVRAPPDPGLG